jgi:hypothetical protein
MGFLAQARGELFGEAVYYCSGGKRHFVRDGGIITELGFSWPGDVNQLPENDLLRLRPAQWVPRKWNCRFPDTPEGLTSADMREIMAADLSGVGAEIGAFDSPFPVPIDCSVFYGDTFTYDELLPKLEQKTALALTIPNFHARFEHLDILADRSLDFLIASHVIEHTRDPIGAIMSSTTGISTNSLNPCLTRPTRRHGAHGTPKIIPSITTFGRSRPSWR